MSKRETGGASDTLRKAQRMTKGRAKAATKKTFDTSGDTGRISAAVWGQLEPLDRKARDMVARWGDSLPSRVSPDLAGRFHAAYAALEERVMADDAVGTRQVAEQLMRAWDKLEADALAAGHNPLSDAYCVEMGDGRIICFAHDGISHIRKTHPHWIVYSYDDAARILSAQFAKDFIEEAVKAFPDAKVTKYSLGSEYDDELEDALPF
jgi:hypothetical protein